MPKLAQAEIEYMGNLAAADYREMYPSPVVKKDNVVQLRVPRPDLQELGILLHKAERFTVAHLLEGLKYTILGSGSYGVAVTMPGADWVLKVAHSAPDDGYPEFAEFAEQHAGTSPHLPVVYETYHPANKNLFFATIELLTEYETKKPGWDEVSYSDKVTSYAKQYGDPAAEMLPDSFKQLIDRLRADIAPGLDPHWDVHSGNIMIRTGKKGERNTVVLTDPFSDKWRKRQRKPRSIKSVIDGWGYDPVDAIKTTALEKWVKGSTAAAFVDEYISL